MKRALNVIRVGEVSKVNYEAGTIEVTYKDRDDSVTSEICMISNALYRMPVVGTLVAVLHNSDSAEMGTCIGTFWNTENKPVSGAEGLYRYDFNDEQGKAYEKYDGKSGDYERAIDGNTTESTEKNAAHEVKGNVTFTVGGDMTFAVGSATVKVKQNGSVEISGQSIKIEGTTINLTGSTLNISGGSGDCVIAGISLVNHKQTFDGAATAGPYTVSGTTGKPM